MKSRLWLWIIAALLCSLLVVGLPVWLIYPFREQTQRIINISYTLRKISPAITILCAATILLFTIKGWRRYSFIGKLLAMILGIISLGSVWFSLQNHFEWMFHPLPNAAYARANEVSFLDPDDMILAVCINRDAAAYPVRFLAYHHLVQDVIGGQPVVATY